MLPQSRSSAEETDGLAEMIQAQSAVYRSSHRSFFLGHTGWKEEEFDAADLIPQMAPRRRRSISGGTPGPPGGTGWPTAPSRSLPRRIWLPCPAMTAYGPPEICT